jgi:hypothetical protein
MYKIDRISGKLQLLKKRDPPIASIGIVLRQRQPFFS